MTGFESVTRIIIILILAAYYHWQWSRREWFLAEQERNDLHEPPSERQLSWDVRHMREDLYMIAVSLNLLVFLLIAYVVWHW